jgi:CRISPR-associated protein Csm2
MQGSRSGNHQRGGAPSRGPAAGSGAGGRGAQVQRLLRDQATSVYFEPAGGGAPRPALLDSEAEETARKLGAIPASQLRRFYGAVMTLRHRLELDPQLADEAIRGEMALLKAKAAYTLARGTNWRSDADTGTDPDELVRFFVRNGRAVQNRADFFAFCKHFEAVMAFHKIYEQKSGRD